MSSTVPSVELNNGQEMPVIGLGTWASTGEDVKVAVNAALESGYRHIDTAYLYQNESQIGEVLTEWFASGKLTREDLFITSKLPMIGNRAEDVSKFLQKSLDMLKLTYVDLYLIHNPVGFIGKDDNDVFPEDEEGNTVLDKDTDLEAIWGSMEDQVEAGKAKCIGLSTFNSQQIERIMKVAKIKPASVQIEVNAYFLQRDLRGVCEEHDIPVCAFCPLGAPYLKPGTEEYPHLLEHPTVIKLAEKLEKTTSQILLRHLIQHDLCVIPKSINPEHINENFQVFDFELSSEDMEEMDSIDRGVEGRIFTFGMLKGIERHPEYPL